MKSVLRWIGFACLSVAAVVVIVSAYYYASCFHFGGGPCSGIPLAYAAALLLVSVPLGTILVFVGWPADDGRELEKARGNN